MKTEDIKIKTYKILRKTILVSHWYLLSTKKMFLLNVFKMCTFGQVSKIPNHLKTLNLGYNEQKTCCTKVFGGFVFSSYLSM